MPFKISYIIPSIIFLICSFSTETTIFAQHPELEVSVSDTLICSNQESTVLITIPGVDRGFFSYIHLGVTYSKSLSNGTHSFQVSEVGTYTITTYGEFSESGELVFTAEANIPFTIYHYIMPNANITGGGEFCEGDEIIPIMVNLTGQAPWILTYILDNSSIASDTFNVSPGIIPATTSQEVEIRLLSDKNCQTEVTGFRTITVIDNPEAEIIGDTVFCPNDIAEYSTAYNPQYRYLWNIPIGASAIVEGDLSADKITVQWNKSGTHLILLRVETIKNNCSTNILHQEVFVYDLPNTKKNYDTIVCFANKDFITLTPSQTPENIVYWPQYDLTDHSLDITEDGNYKYIETIPFGCVDSGAVRVLEKCIPEIFVPEAFTPNNDNINDYLEIYGVYFNLELEIFSLNGELVYFFQQDSPPWDGNLDGTPAPNGVYYWKAKFTNEYGDPYSNEGQITLLR